MIRGSTPFSTLLLSSLLFFSSILRIFYAVPNRVILGIFLRTTLSIIQKLRLFLWISHIENRNSNLVTFIVIFCVDNQSVTILIALMYMIVMIMPFMLMCCFDMMHHYCLIQILFKEFAYEIEYLFFMYKRCLFISLPIGHVKFTIIWCSKS